MPWVGGGVGRDTSSCSWRSIFSKLSGALCQLLQWQNRSVNVPIHLHSPFSAPGMSEGEVTADSPKPSSHGEWVSATRPFSHFSVVMNLKPKNVWLILSRKCSCCGYTTRNLSAVTFLAWALLPPAPSARLSHPSVWLFHRTFLKHLSERYKPGSCVEQTG